MIYLVTTSALGGLLLSFAFPSAGLDFVAWIAFTPLFASLDRTDRPSRAVLCGFVFGFVFFLFDLSWIYRTLELHGHFSPPLSVLLLLCMTATLGLIPAVFSVALYGIRRNGFNHLAVAPFVWVALEYVRSTAFTGFPWDLTGYSQANRLLVVQISDITGVYGVSFFVVLVNAAIWSIARSLALRIAFPGRIALVTAVIAALVFGYGLIRLGEIPAAGRNPDGFPIGVLQANIAQEIKWTAAAREYTFLTYQRLGEVAVERGADFLVWAETSVPIVFGSRSPAQERPTEISSALGIPLLVGAPRRSMNGDIVRYYNSAFLIDGESFRFRYDKMHLVPFGEYMPLTWLLPLGAGIAVVREADYSPGSHMTVMEIGDCPPFSVLICYEAIFPYLSREALRNGARMLINITNDAWFGASAAPYQHLAMARVRSVEHRVFLVRCANTGVSAAFDRAGRNVERIPLNEEGLFVVRVPRDVPAGSFYTRFGDLFAWGCVGWCGLIAAGIVLSGRNTRPRNGGAVESRRARIAGVLHDGRGTG